jgi:hypothetical protein
MVGGKTHEILPRINGVDEQKDNAFHRRPASPALPETGTSGDALPIPAIDAG